MLERKLLGAVVLLGFGLFGCGSGDDDSSDSSGTGGYTYLETGGTGGTATNGKGGTSASSGGTGATGSGATGGSFSSGAGKGGSGGTGTGGGGGSINSGGSAAVPSDSEGEGGDGNVDPTPPGDQYEAPGTNPFTLTTYDPLSTFGADVDTASYDIFRRDIEDGVLPEPSGVRLEEYVNAFAYDYPAPAEDAEDPFRIHLAAAPGPFNAGSLLLRVGIQGKLAPSERGPANLVFLVDVSGSMASEDKLPLVKVVLEQALEVLRPTDRVSIVTYAGATSVALEPTPVSEKTTIRAVIEQLGAGGGTAGGAGMTLAYAQAAAGFVEGGINHIVMCTDGDFNVGLSSDQEMLNLITEKRKTGITLTTLGFGSGNLNDSMMEKVSNAGNGMYSVISSYDQAVEYASERLLSTMLHIAKDMKLQVEFNAERVLAYRLLGYEDRAIADDDFRDDAVDAGEIGVGHRVTALYEVVPTGGVVPAAQDAPELLDGDSYTGPVEVSPSDLVLVKIRYKQPGASVEDAAKEVRSSLAPSDVAQAYGDLDEDFRWAVAVAGFAEILKESPYARPERLPDLAAILDADPHATGERPEFVGLFSAARVMLETAR